MVAIFDRLWRYIVNAWRLKVGNESPPHDVIPLYIQYNQYEGRRREMAVELLCLLASTSIAALLFIGKRRSNGVVPVSRKELTALLLSISVEVRTGAKRG